MRFGSRFGIKKFGEPSNKFAKGTATLKLVAEANASVIVTASSSGTIALKTYGYGNVIAVGSGVAIVRSYGHGTAIARRFGSSVAVIRLIPSLNFIRRRLQSSFVVFKLKGTFGGIVLSWDGEGIPCSNQWMPQENQKCLWSAKEPQFQDGWKVLEVQHPGEWIEIPEIIGCWNRVH